MAINIIDIKSTIKVIPVALIFPILSLYMINLGTLLYKTYYTIITFLLKYMLICQVFLVL